MTTPGTLTKRDHILGAQLAAREHIEALQRILGSLKPTAPRKAAELNRALARLIVWEGTP